MNKRSVKRKPAKTSRSVGARKPVSRHVSAVAKSAIAVKAASGLKPANVVSPANAVNITAIAVPQQMVGAPRQMLRAHKFRVGQTVLYTSSPVSRPGASGSYKVVKLLPSDGDDYQYRIKNSGEAFERVAKESQLELDH
jgi:hypothetical protein